MTGPSSNPRPRVDQLTDDMLDALYTELWHLRLDKEGASLALQAAVRQTEEERRRADKAEAELAALKTITTGYCPHCGRGDCSPTADQWAEQKQRADRAEAAIARVRALHTPVQYRKQTICGHCSGYGGGSCDNGTEPHPCATLRALDGTT